MSSACCEQTSGFVNDLFNWKKRKGGIGSSSLKRKKIPTWTNTFVCLADMDQEVTPDGQERAELQIAEKRITLNACGDVHDIYHELQFQFPKLNESGGFELLKVARS